MVIRFHYFLNNKLNNYIINLLIIIIELVFHDNNIL
jgi:hypothetical protein